MSQLSVARSELILGGQKSGKSARAECLARHWLAQSDAHKAVLIATAKAWDEEMRQRIERHRAQRARHLSAVQTVEEQLALAQVITCYSQPQTLIIVDCLTLWLTNWLMPAHWLQTSASALDAKQSAPVPPEQSYAEQEAMLLQTIKQAPGPLVLVSGEIGLGVIPMGQQTRVFVDALGLLNQALASVCQRVTLVAAGLPLSLKNEV